MPQLTGLNGEALVLDGDWLVKTRGGAQITRKALSGYRETKTKEVTRRTRILFGQKETLIQVVVALDTFVSLSLPEDRRIELDDFIRDLEAAAAGTTG